MQQGPNQNPYNNQYPQPQPYQQFNPQAQFPGNPNNPTSPQQPYAPVSPPYPPAPQLPPRRRRGRPWLWIIGIIVILGACGICGQITNTHTNAQPSTNASAKVATTATTQLTHTATQTAPTTKKGNQSKATATSLPAPTNGPITIGQPISNFLGSYGQPMNDQWKQGNYMWQQGAITALVLEGDNGHVNSILYDNADGNGWSNLETATTACRAFIPSDSKYERTIDITSGGIIATERVYYSASLATLLPASDFWDENLNQTKADTFAIVYTYDQNNPSRVLNCSVQVGLQGK